MPDVMTAKALWEELNTLRQERPDFDELEVYVVIYDRESFDKEQAMIEADDTENEYTVTSVGEGSVYAVVVPTGFDMSGPEPVATGDYLLIHAVEPDDEEGEDEA
jgi:hypothetical protein